MCEYRKTEQLITNLVKAEAVIDFCKVIASAIDDGFLDDGFSINDIYQMGRDHAKSRYDVNYQSLTEWREHEL